MAGGEDPYGSVLHYDLEYEDYLADLAWYVDLARSHGGPVLELGCGNGRVLLEIARAGIEAHGIDDHANMLQDLEKRLRALPDPVRMRVRYRQCDFLELEGPARYPLVILPFNAVHHCQHHRDVLRLLRGVRACLRPEGRFALDMYRPYPELYGRDPDERYGEKTFKDPRTGETIESWEQSWYDPLTQVHHVTYTYLHDSGERHQTELALRVFYPREFEALLDWGGFEIDQQYRDFRGRPLRPDATKWVMVLKPR